MEDSPRREDNNLDYGGIDPDVYMTQTPKECLRDLSHTFEIMFFLSAFEIFSAQWDWGLFALIQFIGSVLAAANLSLIARARS